jgi:hypothetical protein
MAQTGLGRFFLLGTSSALLVLLAVACGDEATSTPSPSLAPTRSPTSAEEPGGTMPPYPPSPVIEDITWHGDTFTTAAPGSDIW